MFTCLSYGQPQGNNPAPVPMTRITSSIDIIRLVDLVAKLNQVEVEYQTNVLKAQQVTFRLVHEVTPHELWDLCLTVLHSKDLTIIRRPGRDGLYAVVLIAEAAKETLPSDHFETGPLAPGYQSVIRSLHSVDPNSILDSFKQIPGYGPKLSVTPSSAVSGVIVSGLRDRVEYALDLLTKLDNAKSRPVVTVIQVVNRPAVEVVSEIKAISTTVGNQGGLVLVSDLSAVGNRQAIRIIGPESELDVIRELIRTADTPSEIETKSFDPRGYPLDTVASFVETIAKDSSPRGSGELWKVVQDKLTNTLIISGTSEELINVESAIEQLAKMPADSRRIIKLIPIKNREATKIREIASQLLGENAGAAGSTSLNESEILRDPGVQASQRGGGDSFQSFEKERDLELAVDSEMNTIIATGTPKRIEQLESIIKDLDVRQPQVQLEIIMISLSESESRDLGVELAGNIDTGKTLIGLGSLFGLSAVSPSSTSAQATGNGGSAVILSPGDFSAVIRAINTVNDGRSASMPSIVVNNNETATLNSTTTQPFVTTTIADSATTTARGGSASAGTTITVSPQIAAGDDIVLDYSVTLSSFVGEASTPGVEPPTQQTSLNSIATIPDGYTIALGGIEITTQGNSDTKTPGLADIPILGALFKSQSDSTSRSRFYVFIRTTVMRSPSFEHLKYISEELAREFEIDDGWPTVEPRIIR